MKKNFVILLAFSLPFLHCKTKPQNNVTDEMASVAIAYYDSINYVLNIYRPIKQKFIDETAITMLKLTRDKNAIIDTVTLFFLFDSAYKSNQVELEKIKNIPEVDTVINYKAKVVKYLKHFNELCEKEFPDHIRLLGKREFDKIYKYNQHFMPKLLALKEYGKEFKEAQTEFKTKYNFTTPKE